MLAENRTRPARSPIAGRAYCLLLLSLLTTACGGGQQDAVADSQTPGTATSTMTGPSNACKILPASVVQEVVGVAVRDSLALSMTGPDGIVTMSQCNYALENNPAALSFMIRRSAPGETAERASQALRDVLNESTIPVEDVAGLGDIAFFGSNQLHVYVGDTWYLIVSPQPAAGLAQARGLAERAIQGL